jgi:preprotein translocase subunit SecF
MKRVINFSKYFFPAMIFSLILIAAGIAGYLLKGGFNMGVDFKAGLIQEVQFAPRAFSVSYGGTGNASVSFSRTGMELVISGADTDGATHRFAFADYPTLGSLAEALRTRVEGVSVETRAPDSVQTAWFILNAYGNPQINTEPYTVHYLEPGSAPVELAAVRESLSGIGDATVQMLGAPADRHFLIRVDAAGAVDTGAADSAEGADDSAADTEGSADTDAASTGADASQGTDAAASQDTDAATGPATSASDRVVAALEAAFGEGEVVVTRSDFVGSRFSEQLANQAGILMFLTMLLILAYVSLRFRPQFAIGAVLAIAHDALIMVAFIAWSRMEFATTTIAAILTILGYSINDTIVIFDRIRETRRLFPDDTFSAQLDRSITETLGRTIITTLTTMLAVLSLYIFASGSMKDFALALLVGMVSGVYSTIFIACGFANFWDRKIRKTDGKAADGTEDKSPAGKTAKGASVAGA